MDDRGIWLCPPEYFANEIRPGCRLDEDKSVMTGQCFEQIQHSDDARLNQVYKELISELTKRGKKRPEYLKAKEQLIKAQRQWIRFRDLDCIAVFTRYPNDSDTKNSINRKHGVCMMEHTQQRWKNLSVWFNWEPEKPNTEMK